MPSRRRRLTLLLALCCATALAVVGAAAADRLPIELNAADVAAARAAVLTRADMGGAGWKGGARKPDFSASTCPGYDPKRSDLVVTGAAASEWSHASGLSFFSETWVMKTKEMVRLDWQRSVEHPGFLRCAREEFGSEPGVKLVSFRRIDLPRLAPLARRYRLLTDYTEGGRTVRVMVDVILLGRGRTEISLLASAPYAARKTVAAAELRLARALLARARA